MKKIHILILTLAFLFASPIHASAMGAMITSGYTEEGVYYEVYGDICTPRSNSMDVTREVVFNGDVTPAYQISWEERMGGYSFKGTLYLTEYKYNKKSNQTTAYYEGTLYRQN